MRTEIVCPWAFISVKLLKCLAIRTNVRLFYSVTLRTGKVVPRIASAYNDGGSH